ncbi:glucosaminidase domain-containing protein [Alphaproteobacteria bacterium]|nr:glucosaminidase domain-containing protein [Alphaproteobacteria bacterium]MDC3269599.1 glucosaminidase domain-containing protein [Alphaproteobacteria bacterium]
MRNLFIFTFLSFLFASITTTAFEDDKKNNNKKIIYKLNANLDDLVLNYCTTYDSYTVNRLYSQKKILDEKFNTNKLNKFLVSLKKKPLNPSVFKLINKETELKIVNQNINDINLDFLSQSKKDFVKTLLPLISYQNQNILLERSKLEELKASLIDHNTLTNTDLKFLNKISQKYRIKTADKHKYDLVNELLNRVDIIPNSIVLAQAANESGWGSSRFAREFNALFGEYTYNYSDGVVPLLREEGEKHLVKTFTSVDKSVQSYFNNLNSHYAYEDFREVREMMREKNNFSNIKLLVEELDSYAADINYITTINAIIDANKLDQFDVFSYSVNNS